MKYTTLHLGFRLTWKSEKTRPHGHMDSCYPLVPLKSVYREQAPFDICRYYHHHPFDNYQNSQLLSIHSMSITVFYALYVKSL